MEVKGKMRNNMSDYRIKIIPTDPYLRYIPHAKIQKAIKLLNTKNLSEDISAVYYKSPVFVDCGVNLEEIKCNFCGKILDFDWWGEVINKAAENSFRALVVEMPCCHKKSSLNDLEYHFPCGFACVEIDLLNPILDLDDACLILLQELLGVSICIVYS